MDFRFTSSAQMNLDLPQVRKWISDFLQCANELRFTTNVQIKAREQKLIVNLPQKRELIMGGTSQ